MAYEWNREQPLTDLPAKFYALQLLAMSSQEEVDQFLAEQQLQGMTSARVERNGKLFYVLLAGIYEDDETAERAALSLEAELTGFEPWLRPLRTLQDAIRRADRLAGD